MDRNYGLNYALQRSTTKRYCNFFVFCLFFTLQYCIGFAIHQHASIRNAGGEGRSVKAKNLPKGTALEEDLKCEKQGSRGQRKWAWLKSSTPGGDTLALCVKGIWRQRWELGTGSAHLHQPQDECVAV